MDTNYNIDCFVPHFFLSNLLFRMINIIIKGWAENDRGVSFIFGEDTVASFLQKHDLDLIVRAHQVVEDGYQFFAGRKLVTVFSAPNYCGEFDNAGAMMTIDESLLCSFQILKPSMSKQKRLSSSSSSSQERCYRESQPQLL